MMFFTDLNLQAGDVQLSVKRILDHSAVTAEPHLMQTRPAMAYGQPATPVQSESM